ncbi:hypothetical protein G7054_g12505 [Neopestalotiopsis clavispora]|nr:hypothetical protein G7054_g12505 [Neopestalotiopsis clavispora]
MPPENPDPARATPFISPGFAMVLLGNGPKRRRPCDFHGAQAAISKMTTHAAFLGLENLQGGQQEWLCGAALDAALEFRYRQQPRQVQDMINLLTTTAVEGLFGRGNVFHEVSALDSTRFFRLLDGFRSHEFTIWPIDTGTH